MAFGRQAFLAAFLALAPATPAAAGTVAQPAGGATATLVTRAAELALTERLRDAATEVLERTRRQALAAAAERARHAHALRTLDAAQQTQQEIAAAWARSLSAVLATLGPAPHDGRGRALLASVAATARNASTAGALAPERAEAARLLRAAMAQERHARLRSERAAEAARAAADRWRCALRDWIGALARAPGSSAREPPILTGSGLVNLALAPVWARSLAEPAAVRKHRLPLELQLDRRLLRGVQPVPGAGPVRRAMAAATHPVEPQPIVGTLTRPTARGGARRERAWAITTRVAQTVSAPTAGEVVYAGAFRRLGQLLIIDRGGGYHVLLVGLSRLDVRLGARLVAGQAVGEIVPARHAPARLQVELRYRGRPIDASPVLAAHLNKVTG